MHPSTFLVALVALASTAFAKPSRKSSGGLFSPGKYHPLGKTVKKRSLKPKQCVLKPAGTAASASTNGTTTGGTNGPKGGMITVKGGKCGANGAVIKTTATAGPNGSLDWMDCGINSTGGWSPPTVKLSDLVYMDLDTALQNPNSPFKACTKYLDIFKSVAASTKANGTPLQPILLASFAMQESSCNPQEQGGGGEVGMFQLSEEKCPGGKASSACYDVQNNTQIAAKYVASQIESSGGNVFAMVGQYNGWYSGMTFANATAAKNGPCCRCQNNLDYLHQFFNGWMLNIDAYTAHLGKYFNLNDCGASDALGRRDDVTYLPLIKWTTRPEGGWRF